MFCESFQPNPDFDKLFSIAPDDIKSHSYYTNKILGIEQTTVGATEPIIVSESEPIIVSESEPIIVSESEPTPETLIICYSPFDSKKDNRAGTIDVSWLELVTKLSTHKITENKEDAGLFNGILFVNNKQEAFTRRCAENAEYLTLLILDFDGKETIESVQARFNQYEYCAYTSHSHLTEFKNHKHCFRAVLPLRYPVAFSTYKLKIPAIQDWAGNIDKSSTDRSRAFYLPSCPERMWEHSRVWHNKGQLLDLSIFADKQEGIPTQITVSYPPITDIDKQNLMVRLIQMGSIPRHDYIKVIWGLKAGGFTEYEVLQYGRLCQHEDGRFRTEQEIKATYREGDSTKCGIGAVYNILKQKEYKEFLQVFNFKF